MKAISISLVLALAANAVAQAQYGGGTGSDDGPLTLRATTPAESYSRGIADLVRSGGLYNLSTSEAALKAAEAWEYEMKNATQALSTYFQIRQLNREYRAANRRPPPSKEDLARYAQARRPKPLSQSEFDTVTGRLSWPVLLRTKALAGHRTAMGGVVRPSSPSRRYLDRRLPQNPPVGRSHEDRFETTHSAGTPR